MGQTAGAIPNRLQRGEMIDVVIMAGEGLDDRRSPVIDRARTCQRKRDIALCASIAESS